MLLRNVKTGDIIDEVLEEYKALSECKKTKYMIPKRGAMERTYHFDR